MVLLMIKSYEADIWRQGRGTSFLLWSSSCPSLIPERTVEQAQLTSCPISNLGSSQEFIADPSSEYLVQHPYVFVTRQFSMVYCVSAYSACLFVLDCLSKDICIANNFERQKQSCILVYILPGIINIMSPAGAQIEQVCLLSVIKDSGSLSCDIKALCMQHVPGTLHITWVGCWETRGPMLAM